MVFYYSTGDYFRVANCFEFTGTVLESAVASPVLDSTQIVPEFGLNLIIRSKTYLCPYIIVKSLIF